LSAGEAITAPLTATRPAAIQLSAWRREASPARAITLAMRSPDLSSVLLLAMPTFLVMAGLDPAIHVDARIKSGHDAGKAQRVPTSSASGGEGI
jgi:hypothetical protein